MASANSCATLCHLQHEQYPPGGAHTQGQPSLRLPRVCTYFYVLLNSFSSNLAFLVLNGLQNWAHCHETSASLHDIAFGQYKPRCMESVLPMFVFHCDHQRGNGCFHLKYSLPTPGYLSPILNPKKISEILSSITTT